MTPVAAVLRVAAAVAALSAAALSSRPTVQNISSNLSVDNWALDRIDGSVDGTYTYRATGSGVNIYLIDTGVYADNVDFGERIHPIGNFFGASSDRPISDDIRDCVGGVGGYGGHGTHNASYAAGRRYGVAKAADVFVAKAVGPDCNSDAVTLRHAVDAITNRFSPGVVNISFFGAPSGANRQQLDDLHALEDAIRRSMDRGFVYVLAAGCEPVADSWGGLGADTPQRALIVAGVDKDLETAGPDRGPTLSLWAPGMNVLGAGNRHAADKSVQRPEGDHTCSDSFAAPHVAGAAALYLERHPGATALQVHDAIVDGAASLPGLTPNRLLRLVY